ncbi:MAG: hypothetical protein ACXAC5_11750 [Promethearchaeota archaeon]|jgi:hypothetical protein
MIQNGFFVEVIKTTKVNVDDSSHELPPYGGAYQEYKVADYFCPEEWSNDGVFVAVKEGDPLWFDFRRNNDEFAILCAIQRLNPVTGDAADLDAGLTKDPAQNYLKMPEQQWLDGYAKDGKVYQFVVTKAGVGLAVNEFVLPKHMQDSHALGFAFFGPKNPKPGVVVRPRSSYIGHIGHHGTHKTLITAKSTSWNCAPQNTSGDFATKSLHSIDSLRSNEGSTVMGFDSDDVMCNYLGDSDESGEVFAAAPAAGEECGAAAEIEAVETIDVLAEQEANLNELDKASMGMGGRIRQTIVTDNNTVDYYHEKRSALLTVYFALPEMFKAIMKKGKRQDATRKDKFKTSGHVGGVAVPLIGNDD